MALFTETDLIYRITRQDLLDAGELIDVTELACEAGFTCPVAVTAALWADVQAIPEPFMNRQSATGRLWDVLWMAYCAIRRAPAGGSELTYDLIMHVGADVCYTVKLMAGPGDAGELVITLLKVGQD